MTSYRFAQKGRLRHRLVEPGLAAFAALLLITAAQAALPPHVGVRPLAARPAAAPVAPKAVEPAEPVVLIAFAQPVADHPVVSPFGLRQMPWEAHGRLHEGVDIAAPNGEAIRATADGVVTRTGESASYGRFVEIKHAEGLVSFYAHMGAIDPAIESGQALKAGTVVGAIGNSGTSTGPHLHFEIRDPKGRPLNPAAFLGLSFASAAQLPLKQAAKVSGYVRLAHVSRIPASKRDLMQAKLDGKSAGKADRKDDPQVESWIDAKLANRDRVRAQIRMINQAQHREGVQAPQYPRAASAGEAGVPASSVQPIIPGPAALDLQS